MPESGAPIEKPLSYWRWFFVGRNGLAGWKKFVDRWLLVHAAVGTLAAALVPGSMVQSAQTVLLPLAGVFVGMSFAWVGNIQAVLQSDEAERLYGVHPGGPENYAYSFQSAILAVLASIGFWAAAGMGVFDRPCPWACPAATYDVMKGILFAFISLAVRECWHVVLGAQMLLLVQRYIRHLPRRPGEGGSG